MKNFKILFKVICILSILIIEIPSIFSQVGIGILKPNSNSILELFSSNKGFLPPRMNTNLRNKINLGLPDKGMMVYDTDVNSLFFWEGSQWIQISTSSSGLKSIYNSDGDISPTNAVNRNINFTNGGSLEIDNNTLKVDATNNRVGIGTSVPNSLLDLGNTFGTSPTDKAGKKLAVFNSNSGSDFYGLGIHNQTLQFHASSTPNAAPKMVLNNKGFLGLGNTDPIATLHIEGSVWLNKERLLSKTKTTKMHDIIINDNGFVKTGKTYIIVDLMSVPKNKSSQTIELLPSWAAVHEVRVTTADACGHTLFANSLVAGSLFGKTFKLTNNYHRTTGLPSKVIGPTKTGDKIKLNYSTEKKHNCSGVVDKFNFDLILDISKGTLQILNYSTIKTFWVNIEKLN